MNIQEMHLSVMQGVDKINAQVADTLLSGELDRELNKAIQQFVSTRFQQNNKYGQGFEESQKRRDDLRTLVTEVNTATDFKEEVRDATHPDGALYVDTWKLPHNYMHMINATTTINRLPDCSKIPFQLEDQDAMYYFVLNFEDFIGNSGTTYIDELWIVNDYELGWGSEDMLMSQMWSNTDYEGVSYPDNQAEVIQSILDIATPPVMPVFWETWDSPEFSQELLDANPTAGAGNIGVYNFPNSIILAMNVEVGGEIFGVLNADASLGPVTTIVGRYNNENVVSAPIRFNNDLYLKRVPSTTDFIRESYPCRMVQHDDVYKLVGDPFNKTKYSSPLTVMRGENIDIYSDDIYLTDRLNLTYLRQPANVSLALGVNCDLPDPTHEEICKLAVASILEEISDPRYQTHLMQVDKME